MEMTKEQEKNFEYDYKRLGNYSSFANVSRETLIARMQNLIQAIREERVILVIKSVAKSGMTREMALYIMEKVKRENKEKIEFRQADVVVAAVGYKFKTTIYGTQEYKFTVKGCGMDMCYDVIETIIATAKNWGVIDENEHINPNYTRL
jgi:hypothetical protein